jgi:hypothetical protein
MRRPHPRPWDGALTQMRPGKLGPKPETPPSKHALETLQPKPRTTVKLFASELKCRIERAARAFDQPGQDERVAGMRYVLGIVDAALSDFDVRDPGDFKCKETNEMDELERRRIDRAGFVRGMRHAWALAAKPKMISDEADKIAWMSDVEADQYGGLGEPFTPKVR